MWRRATYIYIRVWGREGLVVRFFVSDEGRGRVRFSCCADHLVLVAHALRRPRALLHVARPSAKLVIDGTRTRGHTQQEMTIQRPSMISQSADGLGHASTNERGAWRTSAAISQSSSRRVFFV